MEQEQHKPNRVRVTSCVFEGLEHIRQSGVTNMLDRGMVWSYAREWGFEDTAEWIASHDTTTYGRMILNGVEAIDDESLLEWVPSDGGEHAEEEVRVIETRTETSKLNEALATLGKKAVLAVADSYETEEIGVLIPAHVELVTYERNALIRTPPKRQICDYNSSQQ